MAGETLTRRPIAARNTGWARACAGWLARKGFRPNAISVASIGSAGLAGACMISSNYATGWARAGLLILAIAFIQGRLLCNLFDGMVAVEGGLKSKSGEIYNELPDRFADLLILVCAGYAEPEYPYSSTLGWAAGSLAVLTAYVRSLGASAGASQQFCGPMAKQQRMFIASLACLSAAAKSVTRSNIAVFPIFLAIIIVGCVVTIARRVIRIVRELESK
jgi:phosphatidylglycerophosphate synthase